MIRLPEAWVVEENRKGNFEVRRAKYEKVRKNKEVF